LDQRVGEPDYLTFPSAQHERWALVEGERQVVIEEGSHGGIHQVEELVYGHRGHQPPQPSPWQNRQKHNHVPTRRRACRTSVVGMEVRSFMSRPLGGRCGIVMDAAAVPGNAKPPVHVESRKARRMLVIR
jgi:hypothetical protein